MDEQEEQNEVQEEQRRPASPLFLRLPTYVISLIGIGIVIMLVIVFATIFFLIQPKTQPVDDNRLISVGTEVGEVSDWKTYTNEEFGFEFQYPIKWRVEEVPHVRASLRLEFVEKDSDEGQVMLEIWFGGEDVDDPPGTADSKKELITSDSQGNNLYKTTYYWDETDQLVIYLDINTTSEERGWARYFYFPSNQEDVNHYQHLLSTFKFIEPQALVDTSDWKTYRDEEFGFEFRYLREWNIELTDKVGNVILRLSQKDQPSVSVSGKSVGIGEYRIPLECPWTTHQIDCDHAFNENGVEYVRSVATGQLELTNQQQINVILDTVDTRITMYAVITDSEGIQLPYAKDTTAVIDQIVSTFKFIEPQ